MASQPLRQLFTVLHSCIKGGNLNRALRLLVTNLPRTGGNYLLRRYVADTLLALDRPREAAEIYEILVRHFTNVGKPLVAVSIAKRLAEIEPDIGSHLDHIASVYAFQSPFLDDGEERPDAGDTVEAALDLSGTEPDLPQESLAGVAHELALRKDGFASSPDSVSPILLLSQLDVTTLRRVLGALEPRFFADEQSLLERGAAPTEVLWLVSGRLRVTTANEEVGKLHNEALLGHSLIFNSSPPASVVSATTVGHVEALALPLNAIAELRKERKLIAAAAQLDLAARVDYAVSACGLFDSVGHDQRASVFRRFTPCLVPGDTVLIPEGAIGRGIWLVVAGKVDVNKRQDDFDMTVKTLGPGEVIGEISLVTEGPAVATVVTDGPSRLLYMSRDDFMKVCERFPEILDKVREAAASRLLER